MIKDDQRYLGGEGMSYGNGLTNKLNLCTVKYNLL